MMRLINYPFFSAIVLVAVITCPAEAKRKAVEKAVEVEATTASTATIMSYKRDPVPIYDNSGSRLRDVPKKEMPKAKSAAAQVVGTKPGFVAIMLAGKPAWLRLTTVDYVGNLPAPPCDKVAMQLALNEEDGVERSLGLGCSKPKPK